MEGRIDGCRHNCYRATSTISSLSLDPFFACDLSNASRHFTVFFKQALLLSLPVVSLNPHRFLVIAFRICWMLLSSFPWFVRLRLHHSLLAPSPRCCLSLLTSSRSFELFLKLNFSRPRITPVCEADGPGRKPSQPEEKRPVH